MKGVSATQTREITEKELLLQAIYDNSDAGIVLESPQQNLIIDLNEKVERIFRKFKAELVGTNMRDLLSGMNPDDLSDLLNSLEHKARWSGQLSISDKKGKKKWIQLGVMHFDSAGREYRLWNIQDIDSLKSIQRELELRNEELRDLNEGMDNFVYSVAHDMRGPLSSLKALMKLSEGKPDEESMRMQAELIERMEEYIRDVVNYSQNKRSDVERSNVNLLEVVERIRTELKHFANAPNTELILSFDPELSINTDEYRLKLVLQNLISNAILYADMEKEKAQIEVVAKRADRLIEIQVIDNGQGIEEDIQPRIFDMFFRGNIGSDGTGLGLFLVKESVEKIGGSISLKSTPKEGTTFTIRIPN